MKILIWSNCRRSIHMFGKCLICCYCGSLVSEWSTSRSSSSGVFPIVVESVMSIDHVC